MRRLTATYASLTFAILICLPLSAEEVDLSASGKALFMTNCSVCHGESAQGDGSVAEYLNVAPADLTRLSQRNGGEFPEKEVYQTIDGREKVKGHGTREMPIWGTAFQLVREEDQSEYLDTEIIVVRRITALISYLKIIQVVD